MRPEASNLNASGPSLVAVKRGREGGRERGRGGGREGGRKGRREGGREGEREGGREGEREGGKGLSTHAHQLLFCGC